VMPRMWGRFGRDPLCPKEAGSRQTEGGALTAGTNGIPSAAVDGSRRSRSVFTCKPGTSERRRLKTAVATASREKRQTCPSVAAA
jgi:hypothetical protein